MNAEHPYIANLITAFGGRLPVALQAAVDGDPMPLAIGTGDEVEALLLARKLPADEAQKIARQAMRYITRSTKYREACSDDDAWRHDLNGLRVERVESTHSLNASIRLLAHELRESNKRARGQSAGKPDHHPAEVKAKPVTRAKVLGSTAASRRPGVKSNRW